MSIARLLPTIDAAQSAIDRNLQLPPDRNGRIATITDSTSGISYGFMLSTYDSIFDEFVEIAIKHRVLEIGAAYGSPYLLRSLESPTPLNYTAVDMIGDQLCILARRIVNEYPNHINDITLIEGQFPNTDLMTLLGDGYDAILATFVLHFLDEDILIDAIRCIYRLLKPGGKLFARMTTPYVNVWKRTFIDEMSEKIAKFLVGNHQRPYPGFAANVPECIDVDKVSSVYPEMLSFNHMFLFDVDVTRIMFETERFYIEKCEYQPVSDSLFGYDGRERLVLIAVKPAN
jgi:SAM-dependent methyltransferase